MPNNSPLPAFIRPMLAKPGRPFDSQEHLFEVKWDGIRATVYVERDGYRIMSRQRQVITDRFPELEFLAELRAGTVLDGELVVSGRRPGLPSSALIVVGFGLRPRISGLPILTTPLPNFATTRASGGRRCSGRTWLWCTSWGRAARWLSASTAACP